ncbi:DUF4190 domain-containing protein [Paenibacillus campi]|uniref:DUF4190 domain-containing protein n=1 Tax=Paenibacillus campi TaxID=3106031 RepID=UPI002AFF5112|nr:DUF4190 domain-containing protein [Paenibacillus sp. SGZ-1014]
MDPNQPPHYSQPPYGTPSPYGQHNPYDPYRPNSGKAIAALVLGICSIASLFFLPGVGAIIGILAIIFAILAFKELQRSHLNGKNMAVGGLVCGIIGLLLHILFVIFIVVIIGVSLQDYSNNGSDDWEPTFQQNDNSNFY